MMRIVAHQSLERHSKADTAMTATENRAGVIYDHVAIHTLLR